MMTLVEETDKNNDVKKTKKQLSKRPRNKAKRTKVAKGERVVDFLELISF
jgi:hypothetical protein